MMAEKQKEIFEANDVTENDDEDFVRMRKNGFNRGFPAPPPCKFFSCSYY